MGEGVSKPKANENEPIRKSKRKPSEPYRTSPTGRLSSVPYKKPTSPIERPDKKAREAAREKNAREDRERDARGSRLSFTRSDSSSQYVEGQPYTLDTSQRTVCGYECKSPEYKMASARTFVECQMLLVAGNPHFDKGRVTMDELVSIWKNEYELGSHVLSVIDLFLHNNLLDTEHDFVFVARSLMFAIIMHFIFYAKNVGVSTCPVDRQMYSRTEPFFLYNIARNSCYIGNCMAGASRIWALATSLGITNISKCLAPEHLYLSISTREGLPVLKYEAVLCYGNLFGPYNTDVSNQVYDFMVLNLENWISGFVQLYGTREFDPLTDMIKDHLINWYNFHFNIQNLSVEEEPVSECNFDSSLTLIMLSKKEFFNLTCTTMALRKWVLNENDAVGNFQKLYVSCFGPYGRSIKSQYMNQYKEHRIKLIPSISVFKDRIRNEVSREFADNFDQLIVAPSLDPSVLTVQTDNDKELLLFIEKLKKKHTNADFLIYAFFNLVNIIEEQRKLSQVPYSDYLASISG